MLIVAPAPTPVPGGGMFSVTSVGFPPPFGFHWQMAKVSTFQKFAGTAPNSGRPVRAFLPQGAQTAAAAIGRSRRDGGPGGGAAGARN
jgi:hypothetical protein